LTLQRIIILVDTICVLIAAYSVWQKFLLPYSYIFAAAILAILLAVSIVKGNGHAKSVVFQIFLIFLLTRNIYYLGTQNVIPFGDAYWDYAVEKTFIQQDSIFLISGMVRPTEAAGHSQLTWYSSWPLLHTLGLCFSRVSGIDPFYLNLILPHFFAVISFAFAYLIFEELRVKLKLRKEIAIFALLIYATSPEAIFWQMQFVRQNFATALFMPMLYLLFVSISGPFGQRHVAILQIFAFAILMSHHFTSFTVSLFLILFSIFSAIAKHLGKVRKLDRFFSPAPLGKVSFVGIGLTMFVFMFGWWNFFGTVIWPTIGARLTYFVESFTNASPRMWIPTSSYPATLRPVWVTPFLGLRDLMLYVPAFFGLLILWGKKPKIPEKFFVVYSIVTFGAILIVDLILALEPLRILLLAIPLLAFLSSLFYNKIRDLSKIAYKTTTFMIIILLVLASFMGLWAHNFAPIHLYDSSINPASIGEVTPSFIRLKPFFEDKIAVDNFESVWADVISRFVYLLNPSEYDKIKSLPTENFQQLGGKGNILICSFNSLNMYMYYGHVWTPIETIEEAETVQHELKQYLNDNFNCIYDDRINVLWTTPNDPS